LTHILFLAKREIFGKIIYFSTSILCSSLKVERIGFVPKFITAAINCLLMSSSSSKV
jgi:hypothetical protein